jgi:hypothetical protein
MLDTVMPSKVWDTDGQLVDALKEGSETLQNITDQFTPLMKRFRIFFFWEQEKTDLKTTQDYVCAPVVDGFNVESLTLIDCPRILGSSYS